jgi:hypothetical protein
MAAARSAAASSPPPIGAVAAIQMSGYRVLVTEYPTRALVDNDGTTYVCPSQSKRQARCLIALLAGTTADLDSSGPWRRLVAGDQRDIELERRL